MIFSTAYTLEDNVADGGIGINKFVFPWRRLISCLLSLALIQYVFALNVSANESKTAEEVLTEGFYGFEDSIDVSAFELSPTELLQIFSRVIKDDPYLFFVGGNLRYSYGASGYALTLTPRYTMTAEQYEVSLAYCVGRIRAIAALAEHYESEGERALFLHDFICENFEYDHALTNGGIYDFFLTGRGTCEAYMLLYSALMRECGMESHFAASDPLTHIWNIVLIDGEWYHVDVTWDDSASSEAVSRRHFLCSDASALERGHKDWYLPIEVQCLSNKYVDFDFDTFLQDRITLGDVNHDGNVTLLDLLMLRRWQTGGEDSDFCRFCADLTLDGAVDEKDIDIMRRKLIASD